MSLQNEKPIPGRKEILQKWVNTARPFCQHGHSFNTKGGNFYEFAEATVEASKAVGLPQSDLFYDDFHALKQKAVITDNPDSVVLFESKLLERGTRFYELFMKPEHSFAALLRVSGIETVIKPDETSEILCGILGNIGRRRGWVFEKLPKLGPQ